MGLLILLDKAANGFMVEERILFYRCNLGIKNYVCSTQDLVYLGSLAERPDNEVVRGEIFIQRNVDFFPFGNSYV